MLERTQENETRAAPPLSAIAARRLHSRGAILPRPKTPEAKEKPPRPVTGARNGNSEFIVTKAAMDPGLGGAEDLGAKRREIERRLNVDVVKVATELVDDEMVDASESLELGSEDEAMANFQTQVNLNYNIGSPTPALIQISSFVPNKGNHGPGLDHRHTVFRMANGETLAILGEYDLRVLKGTVTISGATLTKSSKVQRVYAPSTHSLPLIECGGGGGESKNTKKDSEFDAEIMVSSPKSNSGLQDIGKLCPMFGGIWSFPGNRRQGEGVEIFLPLYSATHNVPTLSIPESWENFLEIFSKRVGTTPIKFTSTPPPVIMVTGSKGTGKSTFARILANKLLTSSCTSIAYLDCDPGQPEFSPPGFVSLHRLMAPTIGPPFTHPNPSTTALRIHYTGYTSPREDPSHYIAAIFNLLALYRDTIVSATTPENAYTPLIINTAGWTKGLGLELLADIRAQSQVSDIVFLSGPMERSNPVAEICPESVNMHQIESIPAGPMRFSAADLRSLQIMSYLHHCPEKEKWDFVTPLTSVAPWVVPYLGLEPGVDAFQVLGEQVVCEELITAINGTLVGVVLVDGDELQDVVHTAENLPYLHNALTPPSPETSFAAGLALIRGVDIKNGCIQLLTSIGESEIERWERDGWRIMFVRGRLELPVWEMVGAGVEEAPWVSVGTVVGAEGKGSEVWRVRRNVMRRGQQMGLNT